MIRLYSEQDREILTKMFFDIYRSQPFNYKWLKIEDVERYFVDIEKSPNFLGFVDIEKEVLAGACLGVINNYFSSAKYKINEIFVRKDYQGKSIGKKMLSEIEQNLKDNNISALEISTSKTSGAYKFYQSNGFIKAEDTVHMFKGLR